MDLRKLPDEQQKEIDAARWGEGGKHTLRPTVPLMEDHLFKAYAVLDHGFLRLLDYSGDENSIVAAARISYGRGTKTPSDDRNLIRYLIRHHHTSPLEQCFIKFHVKAPIFLARQWLRHRTQSFSEYSARYSILDNEFYIPEPEHMAAQSKSNNQGRAEVLTAEQARAVQRILREDAEQCYEDYIAFLGQKDERGEPNSYTNANHAGILEVDEINHREFPGLARELARINLTLNTYTLFYTSMNLHNLLHFLRLRADPHAQYEIRAYAEVMLRLVQDWLPNVAAAFENYQLNAFTLSEGMVLALRARLQDNGPFVPGIYGLSKREWAELVKVFPELGE